MKPNYQEFQKLNLEQKVLPMFFYILVRGMHSCQFGERFQGWRNF